MMKFMMMVIFVSALSGFILPTLAGEDNCSCKPRHEDMLRLREFLAAKKIEQAIEKAARQEAESAGEKAEATAKAPDDDQTDG